MENKKLAAMHKAWKLGFALGRREFHFETPRIAWRVRMALYNSVRKAKMGIGDDVELLEAVKHCEVSIVSPTCIAIVRTDKAEDTQAMELAILSGPLEAEGPTGMEMVNMDFFHRSTSGEIEDKINLKPAPKPPTPKTQLEIDADAAAAARYKKMTGA